MALGHHSRLGGAPKDAIEWMTSQGWLKNRQKTDQVSASERALAVVLALEWVQFKFSLVDRRHFLSLRCPVHDVTGPPGSRGRSCFRCLARSDLG